MTASGDPSGNDEDRARLVRDYDQARAAGDADAMAEAALGLAAGRIFGTVPGRVPAFLHEAYSLAHGERRAQLAVAVARVWGYGGDPTRAAEYVAEALTYAEANDDAVLLAQALDAQLLVHWGPDDLDERLRITTRLENTVARVTDIEAQMSAYLWRLTTALEQLDMTAARRQLRALDRLAGESGSSRIRFFAASRRGMEALLGDDLDAAEAALAEALSAGNDAGEPDTYPIERTLTAGIARQRGDVPAMLREASWYEDFGIREGVTSVAAEAAMLWAAAGEKAHAHELLQQLAGDDFIAIARDVDWMLTMVSLTDVAIDTGDERRIEHALRLLTPYAGRGVVNGGAVGFVGVIDDYLQRCCAALGRDDESREWARTAAHAYARIGARWWLRRVQSSGPAAPVPIDLGIVHLRPAGDGIWLVGRDGATTAIHALKGLHYLRVLLDRPGIDVAAVDLVGSGVSESGTGELLDRQGLAAYRRRLVEIDEDVAATADDARAEALEAERDVLLEQIRAATGLGGRRRTTGATSERARVAVRKSIAAAIERVTAVDAGLGRLLRDTVHTGTACRYDPDPGRPVIWQLTDSAHHRTAP